MRALKPKTCRQCGEEYGPRTSLQAVCSIVCAIAQSDDKRAKLGRREAKVAEKASRKLLRERKNGLRGIPWHKKQAQYAFNRYIRARDKGKPCISCNRLISDHPSLTGHSMDCGHYRSVGAAAHLRYNIWNAAAQCVNCNCDLSGAVVDYRISLIRRIGIEKVEQLENDNSIRKFDIEYLKRIRFLFNKKAKFYDG